MSSALPTEDVVSSEAPAVRTIRNRDLHSNTYAVRVGDKAGALASCVLVDPGLDREAIAADLAECGWQPEAVLCTHGHFDHVGSAGWVQDQYKVPVYLCALDLKLAKMANFMLAAFKLPHRIRLPEFTVVRPDSLVVVGGLTFAFHSLPGHTPGSVGIAVSGLLFSGDSLYARQVALSQLPGEDRAQLRRSLRGLFHWITEDVYVYPGHGGSATIAEIQRENEELRAFLDAD